MSTPTTETIAQDLSVAMEVDGGYFGYGYLPEHDAVLVEVYGDDGTIVKQYRMKVTFEEVEDG